MTKKTWIIFAVISIGIVGGLVYLSNGNKEDVSDVDEWKVQSASEKSGNIADQVYGKKDAKVVMIEYGDYQCPGCASAQSTLKTVAEKYKDKMAFVFRNFPLYSIHPNAFAAASFAEAAGLQGKFWEMHDKLYDNQTAWSGASSRDRADIFRGYASDLKLDLEKFDADVASTAISQKISFDQALFRATGAQQSTPYFTLDGKAVPDETWGNDEQFDTFIRDKLSAAGVKLSEETTDEE